MKKHYRAVILASSLVFMGFDMPSCPGQQALQQQVDAMQAKQVELGKQLVSQEAHIKALNAELGQAKTLLGQVSQTVLAQKDAMDRAEVSIKNMVDTLNAMNRPKARPIAVSKIPAGPGKRGHK